MKKWTGRGDRLMLPAAFSTANLPPSERADGWLLWFWPVFDATPKGLADGRFLARNEVWDLGGLVVSHVVAPPSTTVRTRANIAKAPADHWVVSCCRKGMTTLQTDGGLLEAPPHTPFLWSLGEPSCSERTAIDKIQLLLPRDMFPDIRDQLDQMRGSIVDSPAAATLSEYMSALSRWLPSIAPEALPRSAASVHNMISACLVPNADNFARAEASLNGFHLERVRRAVQAHLRSPSLSPEALCKMVGISRSSLYRLFLNSGGIMRYIQRQRLLCAHAILSDPLSRQTILSISDDLCFSDASSFSRAFRREFGSSPSDVRAAAERGSPPLPISQAREPGEVENFAHFLHA
jgi:AraC-like DNA-binding protein